MYAVSCLFLKYFVSPCGACRTWATPAKADSDPEPREVRAPSPVGSWRPSFFSSRSPWSLPFPWPTRPGELGTASREAFVKSVAIPKAGGSDSIIASFFFCLADRDPRLHCAATRVSTSLPDYHAFFYAKPNSLPLGSDLLFSQERACWHFRQNSRNLQMVEVFKISLTWLLCWLNAELLRYWPTTMEWMCDQNVALSPSAAVPL